MSTPLSAAKFLAALRAEGVRVQEHGNWRDHNRDHKGPWGPVHGVMIHHTVTRGATAAQTADSVELCYDGHADLPGPLCHSVGAKDGTIYMVGWGRANHAGLGDDDVLQAVIAERALPPDNEANTDGNRAFYGIELINLGNGDDPWPEAQVEAAARWAAALCRKHGWSERSVIGHKEWQPGKIDPTFDMAKFRARVAKLLAGKPGGSKPPTTPAPTTYTVKSKDTLSGIAKAHKLTLTQLIDLNPALITPGDKLRVKKG
ncbi:N-acetylmuramoyl-L-alanine amidase [Streptomyces cucumeris]|uniref:N-acetylmuramoyl-L-alanine amidase n=1 Tax=Streptomyces cucumeris TaxID=2962890 RepID=UPI003D75A4C6